MKENLNFLNPEDIEALKDEFEVQTFSHDFDLVYENQVPTAGIALINGELQLIRKSKVHKLINTGCLLGVNELLNHQPVKVGCRIKSNSQIVLLGKSEILSSLKNRKSKLFNLIKNLKIGE
ncbi:MAG: hypothetical protein NDI69_14710 [Bacteriovoracaceae bacterium]|nr:hypothetical protein [Bacteriovoracaceae bacterium]